VKACLDVAYRPEPVAACVLFSDWGDAAPASERVVRLDRAEPYVPGEFFRRELPALLRALEDVPPLEVVVIDGYAWLGEGRMGLGARLHEALGGAVPVIGVAKTPFKSAESVAVPVLRGGSLRPLWVTAAGMDGAEAAARVRGMHGEHRLPTLLKRVDQLCRTG
jgi:deoxyribonuclease V